MGGDAVSVLPVVEPLSLVLQTVRPLADAEAGPLVVLPLAHVGLGHARVQLVVLIKRKREMSQLGFEGFFGVEIPKHQSLILFAKYFLLGTDIHSEYKQKIVKLSALMFVSGAYIILA